ncbi:hypothetical protein [Streptomyces sp. Midd1]|uniref:hypothetical protein n=1 Tax=Streptomyces sp. Midd3 TaxID=3161191 RepID=UPI0034DAED0E
MVVLFLLVLAVLLPAACFGTAYFIERAEERRNRRRQQMRLVNKAIRLDIKARDRKHNTMREMRRITREYRR